MYLEYCRVVHCCLKTWEANPRWRQQSDATWTTVHYQGMVERSQQIISVLSHNQLIGFTSQKFCRQPSKTSISWALRNVCLLLGKNMNLRKDMPKILLFLSVCVLIFGLIHRITFELSPVSYPGHWSQFILMFFLLPSIFLVPVQLIIVLISIHSKFRNELLPNFGIFVLVIVILAATVRFIDPMFLLYATWFDFLTGA